MTIKIIDFATPQGLSREMEVQSTLDLNFALSLYSNSKQYYQKYIDTPGGQELVRRIGDIGGNLRILDIGVGMGQSSFYLSDIGHTVSVIEPSYELCQVIDKLSKKFDSKITVYQCSGEEMDKIDEKDFDLCIFNSSLHHCYNPNLAIKNSFNLLKERGKLLVINEVFLKFFQSKGRFYQKLESDPVSMGHYGGNEHAYFFNEYKKMLHCAGFEKITEYIPAAYENPRSIIKYKMIIKINGHFVFSDISLLFRYTWYILAKRLIKINFICKILKKLSLLNISFQSIKVTK